MPTNSDRRRSMLDELLDGQPTTKKLKTTHTAPVSTLLLDAQRALDEKRYLPAIELLTRALANLNDRKADEIHIYALRSSAYVKTAQLDLAFKDAKEMIKRDRQDVRGYLKCAHVEQLRNRIPEAIRVCDHGLKNIAVSDRNHKKLETCMIRLQQQARKRVIYEKGTDPIAVLPTELSDLVLTFFDYKEMVAVLRVSRRWRDVLRSTDTLNRVLDLRRARKTLTYEQVKAAFTRLGKTPRLVALASMNENACRYAMGELSRWIRWESLESLIVEEGKISLKRVCFSKLRNLRNFYLGEHTQLDHDFAEVLHDCRKLEFSCFQGTQLSSGGLATHPPSVNNRLKFLAYGGRSKPLYFPTNCMFPNLERLELNHTLIDADLNLTEYTKLRELTIRKVHIREALRTAPGLQCFELDGPFADIFPQPEEIKMPADELESIIVKGPESIRFLSYSLGQGLTNKKLKHLSISDFVTFSQIAGRSVRSDLALLSSMHDMKAFSNIQSLVIKDDHIIDPDFVLIYTLFPSLRQLVIESEHITDAFVSDLVRNMDGKLKMITLRNCPNVPRDILKWAAARNVEVDIVIQKQTSEVLSGRFVRYE